MNSTCRVSLSTAHDKYAFAPASNLRLQSIFLNSNILNKKGTRNWGKKCSAKCNYCCPEVTVSDKAEFLIMELWGYRKKKEFKKRYCKLEDIYVSELSSFQQPSEIFLAI